MFPSPRAIRTAVAVAAISALSISASTSATAAAPAPRGTLTAVEYAQLTEQFAALKKFDHDKRATWKQGYAACDKAGLSTYLLSRERSDCTTLLGLDQALLGFFVHAVKCQQFSTTTTTTTGSTTTGTTTGTTTTGTTTTTTGTTTTGTTTTPTGGLTATQVQFLACLAPDYQLISRAAKTIYRAQANLRAAALARDLVGRCLLTLAPSRSDIAVMERLYSTTKQLAADVAKISKVYAGTLPASALNAGQIEKDAAAQQAVGARISHIKHPRNVAVCPHQKG